MSIWTEADDLLEAPPTNAAPTASSSVWDEADALLAQPAKVTKPATASTPAPTVPPDWKRADGSTKGLGFFGLLKRPDGGVSSELTAGVNIDGREMDVPTFVPTLTKDELAGLLNWKEGTPLPQSIIEKAAAHARQRLAAGKSVFADAGEQQNLYPELERAAAPAFLGGATAPTNVWGEADALLSSAPVRQARPPVFNAGGATDAGSVKVNGVPTWDALRSQFQTEPRLTVGDATLDDALRRQAPDSELEAIMRGAALKAPPAAALPKPPSPDALTRAARSRALLTSTHGGEAVIGDTPPLGSVPVLDAPAVGAPRVVTGARQLIPATAGGTGRTGDDLLHGANEMLEGLMQTAEPVIAAGAITNPTATAYGLVRAYLAQQVGEAGAATVGASPDAQRLVGNLAAVLSGTLSGADFLEKARADAQKLGRTLSLTAKLSGSGFGTGDVPGFRSNPVIDEVNARGSDVVDTRGAAEQGFTEGVKARPPTPIAPEVLDQVDQVLGERPETSQPAGDVSQNVPRGTVPAPDLVPPGEEAAYNERRVGQGVPPPGIPERRLAPSDAVREAYKADPVRERAMADEARRRADQARAAVDPELVDQIDQVLASEPSAKPEVQPEPPSAPAAPRPRIDDLMARRVGMPPALANDVNVVGDEQRWRQAVTTVGAPVRLEDGTVGHVVEPATEPNTATMGRVLVEHPFEGQTAQRYYPATKLDPVEDQPTAAKPAPLEDPAGAWTMAPETKAAVDELLNAPPDYFRSGSSRPADLEGFIKARVPVGVTATELSPAARDQVAAYLRSGGKVFVDSGAFGGSPNFETVLQGYGRLLDEAGPHAGNLHVVAPDVVGDQAATVALQNEHRDAIQALIDHGARVIVPVQKGQESLGAQVGLVHDLFGPRAVIGIPFNKSAYSLEELVEGLRRIPPASRPPAIHLLGIGERNARYDETIAAIREASPGIRVTSDSNRVAAMFVEGRRPQTDVHTKVEDRAHARVDVDADKDTTELAGALYRGELEAFTPAELERLGKVIGETGKDLRRRARAGTLGSLLQFYELGLDNAIHQIALERARTGERGPARTEAITEEETRPRRGPSTFITEKRFRYEIRGDGTVGLWEAVGKSGQRWKSIRTLGTDDYYPPAVRAALERLEHTGKDRDEAADAAAGDRTPHGATERLPAEGGGGAAAESGADGAATPAPEAETPKDRAARERRDRRARRKQDRDDRRTADAAHTEAVITTAIDKAVADGYTGDRETLRAVILDRVAVIRSFDADYNASDRNPRRLLQEIARLGGISIKAEAGTKAGLEAGRGEQGEIRWLQTFGSMNATGTAGSLGGVSGVFNEARGLSLDDVFKGLKQDGEFTYLTSIKDLHEELRGAAQLGETGADDMALERAVDMLESEGYWWAERPVVGDEPTAADADEERDSVEPDLADLSAADLTFDVRDLEAEGLDVLDTGEVQPHLPGAGDVRKADIETPEVADAPFSLSSESAERAGVEGDLFAGTHERPSFGSKKGMAAPEGPRRWDGETGPRRPAPPGPPKKTDGGTTLSMEVLPGAGKFVDRDVLPGLAKAAEEVVAFEDGIRAVWAPDRISQASRAEAAIIRSNLALRRQRTAKAQRLMRDLVRAWDQAPRSLQLEFAMAIDEGRYDDLEQQALTVTTGPLLNRQRTAASLRKMAEMFKRLNDQKRAEANSLGGKVGRIVHYFPREWVRPGKIRAMVERLLYSRKPLQGRAGFKKARTRDKETGDPFTFKQLYDAGFRPVEYNPARAHLRKWLEMDKWIAARRILLEGKAAKTTRFVRIGEQAPAGWHRYDESFGTVYGPPTITIREAYDERLMSELIAFAQNLGIKLERKPNIGRRGTVWGYAISQKGTHNTGTGATERTPGVSPGRIVTRFAGAEEILTHEIGHILDDTYGLWDRIVNPAPRETKTISRGKNKGKVVTRAARQDKATVARRQRIKDQLRALADLRYEGLDPKKVEPAYKDYVRERPEQMANLVHAFVHLPERLKDVAPDVYWATFNTVKEHPELAGLLEIQKARGVRIGSAEAEVRVQGLVIAGHYYGPPEAVRLLNNHLSPGLGGNKALNLYRFLGNLLNQVQLGLSGFHLVGTALNSAISRAALAFEHASRGQLGKAARAAAEVPIAPLLDIIRGDRALKHYYDTDVNFRGVLDETSLILRGGGGVGWDTFWHASAPERFLEAIRGTVAEAKEGNYPGAVVRAALAAWRAFPALVEIQAKPVMEWWVPRLKLAAFLDLARMELKDLGEKPDELELRKVLGDAWDSIDNRFGELVYDNLFWHRILKDAGMASVRALGWNVGTVREVAGAPLAQMRSLLKPELRLRNTGSDTDPLSGQQIPRYELGREPWLTHKGSYFLALVLLSAVFGALYQKLHTGLNPGELEDGEYDPAIALLDLFFPRTGGVTVDGRPERASLPTYIKDVYAFSQHPWTTTVHKLHPLLSLAGQIWQNEDYYGNSIRDEEDPLLRQALDVATYMERQYRPISVQSYFERQKNQTGGAISAAESFFGINVAPASVTRTALEEYLHEVSPPTHRTKDQAAAAAVGREVRRDIQTRDIPAARQAAQAGRLTERQGQAAERGAGLSGIQRAFQHLTLKQGIHAYTVATPHERAALAPFLERKADNADVPADEVPELREQLKAALALPRTTARPRIDQVLKAR